MHVLLGKEGECLVSRRRSFRSRAIGYLIQSADRLLTGSLNMKPDELLVVAYCDADFGGDVDDMYSTSGGWIQLTKNAVSSFR